MNDTNDKIIIRNGKYLSAFHTWEIIPHRFPWWQVRDEISLMLGTTQPPTGYAVVKPGVVDLDAVEVVKI